MLPDGLYRLDNAPADFMETSHPVSGEDTIVIPAGTHKVGRSVIDLATTAGGRAASVVHGGAAALDTTGRRLWWPDNGGVLGNNRLHVLKVDGLDAQLYTDQTSLYNDWFNDPACFKTQIEGW